MKDAHKPRNAGRKSQTAKPELGEIKRKLDILEEAFEWVAEGKTLRAFCRQNGMPSYRTIYRWLDENPEALSRFARAREDGADAIAEEGLEILETFPMSTANGSIDSAHVAWLRNRFEGRMKLLAKWFPQRYGDKVSMQHEGGVLAKWFPQRYGDKVSMQHEGGVTLNVVTGVSDDD